MSIHPQKQPTHLLQINASSRHEGSLSRELAATITGQLRAKYSNIQIIQRDVAEGIPFVSEEWINANTTSPEQRTAEQKRILSYSDSLIHELQLADLLVLAVPMYNFGVPATFKAWIDMVARAGVTFRYTAEGPQGLLENKKAIVVITTGGTQVGSEIDFVSGYVRHVLGFIGIQEIDFIIADRLNSQRHIAYETAAKNIDNLIEHYEIAA